MDNFMRWNPYITLLKGSRTQNQIAQRTMLTPKNSGLSKEKGRYKMTTNDILLYSQISTFFSHHQRSFFLQQSEITIETESQTLGRNEEILKSTVIDVFTNPSTQWARSHPCTRKRSQKECKSQRRRMKPRKQSPLNQHE